VDLVHALHQLLGRLGLQVLLEGRPIGLRASTIPKHGPGSHGPDHDWYHGRRKDRPIPSQPNPDDDSPRVELAGHRQLGLGGLLIELFLPVAVAAPLLLVLVNYMPYWDLHSPFGLGAFGVLLVVISVFLSIRVDAFTLGRRRRIGRGQILNRAGSRSRLVKFVLGGVVIPVAALTAANRLVLPNRETPLTMASLAVRSRLAGPEASRATQLGGAVLRARCGAAKAEGIRALETLRSAAALDQLLHVLSDDPAVLQDAKESQALSAALASYGAQAKPRLLQLLNGVPPAARRSAAPPLDDDFTRAVEGTGPEAPIPPGGQEAPPTRLPSFLMRTLLQMALKQDAELLALARQTAADEGWSDAVRGQALELISKLGGTDDVEALYAYLEDPSPLLQAHAMKAIAALQSRLSEGPAKGQ
jgi:hypothetical protein